MGWGCDTPGGSFVPKSVFPPGLVGSKHLGVLVGTGGLSPVVALLSHGDNEQGVCTMNVALSPPCSPNVPSMGANRKAGDAPSSSQAQQ